MADQFCNDLGAKMIQMLIELVVWYGNEDVVSYAKRMHKAEKLIEKNIPGALGVARKEPPTFK